jgi:predicted metalloprotease
LALGLLVQGCTRGEPIDVQLPKEVEGPRTPTPPPPGRRIGFEPNQYPDYDEYSAFVDNVLYLIDDYWSAVLPTVYGRAYRPLAGFHPYRAQQGDYGPTCGGNPPDRSRVDNAFYCVPDDYIAWDENFMAPVYAKQGDAAAAIVFAHEWGHAMQARLALRHHLGIDKELSADCLAGAWLSGMGRRGVLKEGDLDEAASLIYSIGDRPGTNWRDPSAHGTPRQRVAALQVGTEGGPTACAR